MINKLFSIVGGLVVVSGVLGFVSYFSYEKGYFSCADKVRREFGNPYKYKGGK